MQESSELPVLLKEEIMSFGALLAIGTLNVVVKVAAETFLVVLYIFPSIGVLRLHAVIGLIVLLRLTLMVKVAILASRVVPSFWPSLMIRVLVIVNRPPVIIRNLLHRVVVVAIVSSQELASSPILARLFMLMDLLHLTLV